MNQNLVRYFSLKDGTMEIALNVHLLSHMERPKHSRRPDKLKHTVHVIAGNDMARRHHQCMLAKSSAKHTSVLLPLKEDFKMPSAASSKLS